MPTHLTRRKSGKTFTYYEGDTKVTDKADIDRINKLAIPPAWKDVKIAKKPSTKIQASGYDAAGRLQAIYSPKFRLKQEKLKFDRILRFAKKLPALRKQVSKDLIRKRLDKDKVLACVVKLIDEAYFRVGNERYAKENQSYGITTLRSKHVTARTTTVTFDFVGKSGKEHHKTISDPQIARIIKRLDELPGYEIFRYQDKDGMMYDLYSKDVNEYIKRHMGEEFTAKDFRTWGGTLLAVSELLKEALDEANTSQTAKKKVVTGVIKRVAKKLGNTPAVARSSYIDPRVIAAYESGKALREVRDAMTTMRPKKYMTVNEQCVLQLLR